MRVLEAAGYETSRSAASLGCWDIVGFSARSVVLVQVKTNRDATPADREQFALYPCPPGTLKLIHIWHDRARYPIVRYLS